MDEDAQREFLAESRENLDRVDALLLELERDPTSAEHLAPIFRAIHTVKGTCGFLGFSRLEAVTHAGEGLLSLAREGELLIDRQVMTALFALIDAVRRMLATIESDGNDGSADDSALIDQLLALQRRTKDRNAPDLAEPVPQPTAAALPSAESTDGVDAVELGRSADNFVRVDLRVLDHLMNLVGELVLVRNQLVQAAIGQPDGAVVDTSQRLNLITTELQAEVLKTRMQPIRNLWVKFPRVVRDLALACGKEIELNVQGEATELDRTVLEAIKDPLVHLLRNAVAHGIEPAVERVAAGKPRSGRISLRAFHQGGRVHIEIADDGAGIHLDKLRRRAVQAGAISAQAAEHLDDIAATALIFLPGVSTADSVTHVSGRGVGMDVVRTNIEKAGGTIDIDSASGIGTTFRLTIPLTLTIIPALIVSAAGERYAIPQSSLLEVLHLEAGAGSASIEQIHGAPVFRLRDRLLPIVYMERELWQTDLAQAPAAADGGNVSAYIIVLQAQQRSFGLVVSSVHEVVEVVVKPLGKELSDVPCFAGATILGDGQVALVLDVPSLARRAHITSADEDSAQATLPAKTSVTPSVVSEALVLLAGPSDERMAIPLSLVARFEELPLTSIERVGNRDEVLQYRGEILPVLRLGSLLAERRERPRATLPPEPEPDQDSVQVIVCACPGARVGLLVHRILDISEEAWTITRPAARAGVQFSAVIRGRVTELLDLPTLFSANGVGQKVAQLPAVAQAVAP